MEKDQKQIEKIIEDILAVLEIDGDFTFSASEDVVEINLETNDSGMVIGFHGEILEALQLVFSLAISKKLGLFVRASIEVGDYKKNRTDWLQTLAIQTKEKVLLDKKEVPLPNLRSWERRIVHMYFQDDAEVISESVGEGRDRTLVIKPRE